MPAAEEFVAPHRTMNIAGPEPPGDDDGRHTAPDYASKKSSEHPSGSGGGGSNPFLNVSNNCFTFNAGGTGGGAPGGSGDGPTGFMGGPPPGGDEPPGGYGTAGGSPPNQQNFMFAIGEKFEIQFFPTVG